jgi:hypothetical protein
MISINPQKIFDFLFIVVSSIVVAMAGNYFFQWDLQFGITMGLILGAWSTLYDLGVHIALVVEGGDEDESEE